MTCPPHIRAKPEQARVHPILKDYFGYCLYKAALRMRVLMDDALDEHGIITPQFAILSVLAGSPPLSQADLGEEMGIDKTTMVKLLDCLEESKLIQRASDRQDRRIKRIKITPEGARIAKRAMKTFETTQEAFLGKLTPAERKTLRAAIPKLVSGA